MPIALLLTARNDDDGHQSACLDGHHQARSATHWRYGARGNLIASGNNSTGASVGSDVIYFMAGLSPRYVTSFVEEATRRIWGSSSKVSMVAARTIPVTQVRGITAEIADRLAEEGIQDVCGLAAADPLRLIRSTNFDERQIIGWIDEAILILTFPEQWQSLENQGITGVIDLVSLVQPSYQLKKDEEAKRRLGAYFDTLCRHLNAASKEDDSKAMLQGVVTRLTADAQTRLIRVLDMHLGEDRADVVGMS